MVDRVPILTQYPVMREFDIGIEQPEDPLECRLAARGGDLGPQAGREHERVDALGTNPLQGTGEVTVGEVEGRTVFRRNLGVGKRHRGKPESGHG